MVSALIYWYALQKPELFEIGTSSVLFTKLFTNLCHHRALITDPHWSRPYFYQLLMSLALSSIFFTFGNQVLCFTHISENWILIWLFQAEEVHTEVVQATLLRLQEPQPAGLQGAILCLSLLSSSFLLLSMRTLSNVRLAIWIVWPVVQ